MNRILLFVAIGLTPAITLSAQTRPTTAPSVALRIERESERDSIAKQLAGYPNLPQAKLGDVVTLGISDGHLTLKTRLAPTTAPSRIEISDLPGISTITLHEEVDIPHAGHSLYDPEFFLLVHYRFDEPNSTVSSITVEAIKTSVQLSWSSENMTGLSEVSLVEQDSPTGPADDPTPANIELRIITQPDDGGGEDSRIELKAPDFLTLRREHPAEVERYIGPILRQLHADAVVLPSDTVLAWQVFSADVKLSPDLIETIHHYVKQLDSDDYHERATAAKSLEKVGPAVVVELSRIDRSKLSSEQTNLIDRLIGKFRPVAPDISKRLLADPAFLLSCLTDKDDFIARTAFAHLQKITGADLNFDFTTHDQGRRDAVQILRERLDPSGKSR